MAYLYVTEFESLAIPTEGGNAPIANAPPVVDQSPVAIAGGANKSAAFGSTTRFVRLHCDAICSIAFSATGTAATASNMRMPASHTEYFGVRPGFYVSVISNT